MTPQRSAEFRSRKLPAGKSSGAAAPSIRPLACAALLLAGLLAGCAGHAPQTATPGATALPAAADLARQPGALRIVPGDSQLEIFVYRDGPMAALGHNHAIAVHDLTGAVLPTADLVGTQLEMSFPLAALVVDDPTVRAGAGEGFVTPVPDAARSGTRDNMLGPKLLDVAQFPTLRVSGRVIRASGDTAVVAAAFEVKGRRFARDIEMRVARTSELGELRQLIGSGEITLTQTDLGLTPFSVMLGALQVRDEMRIRFRIVAAT